VKSFVRGLAAVVLAAGLLLPQPAAATNGVRYLNQWLPAAGYPRECARGETSIIGTRFQNKATINGAAVCSVANGRPASWLQISAHAIAGGTGAVCASTNGWKATTQWLSTQTETLSCGTFVYEVVGYYAYFKSTANAFAQSAAIGESV
jgi:hypothetical protein